MQSNEQTRDKYHGVVSNHCSGAVRSTPIHQCSTFPHFVPSALQSFPFLASMSEPEIFPFSHRWTIGKLGLLYSDFGGHPRICNEIKATKNLIPVRLELHLKDAKYEEYISVKAIPVSVSGRVLLKKKSFCFLKFKLSKYVNGYILYSNSQYYG